MNQSIKCQIKMIITVFILVTSMVIGMPTWAVATNATNVPAVDETVVEAESSALALEAAPQNVGNAGPENAVLYHPTASLSVDKAIVTVPEEGPAGSTANLPEELHDVTITLGESTKSFKTDTVGAKGYPLTLAFTKYPDGIPEGLYPIKLENLPEGWLSTVYVNRQAITDDQIPVNGKLANILIDFTRPNVIFYDGETVVAQVNVEKNKSISTDILTDQFMPANPVKEGFDFVAWNTMLDGSGDVFTDTTIVVDKLNVYAQWKEVTGQDPTPVTDPQDPQAPQSPVDPAQAQTEQQAKQISKQQKQPSVAKSASVLPVTGDCNMITIVTVLIVGGSVMLGSALSLKRKAAR